MRKIAAASPTRQRVEKHRRLLRKQGLRPIQIWVPNTAAPLFQAEAHRQSRAVARSARARADQAFVDAVSDWAGE